MLKSLFSGVSGLQSHQIAMDVESNNIANVNTVGYKYSRANFSDLLSQTRAIATAPQGDLGGKNPVQVGLGSTVNSTTRIFSQGSVQNTDKNTDVAIEGNGFFIVTGNNGHTYKYTRAGDFKFDASGNFVDNNGFIVQGWARDEITGNIDSSAPISSLNIPPGLTTPAMATSEVILKANLNAGSQIEHFSPAYKVESGIPPVAPTPHAIDADGYPIESGDIGVMFNESGTAFSLQEDQGVWISFLSSVKDNSGAIGAGVLTLNIEFELDDGTFEPVGLTTTGGTAQQNGDEMVAAINNSTAITGVTASYDSVGQNIILTNKNDSESESHNIRLTVNGGDTSGLSAVVLPGQDITAYRYQYNPVASANALGVDKTFTTMADLRYAMEIQAQDHNEDGGPGSAKIIVNEEGKFEITNPGGAAIPADEYDMNINVTAIIESPGIIKNEFFTPAMKSLTSVLSVASGGTIFSQSFNAAVSASSVDIYDSLGSKHTLRVEFRKTALSTTTGATWDMIVSVPNPATIDTVAPFNEKTGTVRFNNDGSLSTYSPPNFVFSANNGSAPNQQVSLDFGVSNTFAGLTSFDSESGTGKFDDNGYSGGDLVGIRIDQAGILVGTFSNGRSFGLAQIAMANFTNNEGLSVEGGNIFVETANSGDPIVGTAATASRGAIRSASLEASNVDLSRSLTQLIIIQRGFQANGKTITTSDQLLETLIGLKR